MKKYGKSEEDVRVEKKATSREIVKEIIDFGVNENQKIQIIKLISMELEDINLMKRIINCIKLINDNDEPKKLIEV
jgi:hypothetical protein